MKCPVITMDSNLIHSIIESLDEGIAFINEDSVITFCNGAFATLRETAHLKIDATSVLKLYPPSLRGEVAEILQGLRSERTYESVNIVVQTEAGKQFQDSFNIVRDAYGHYSGIILKTVEILPTATAQDGRPIPQKYVRQDLTEIKKDKTIKEILNKKRKELLSLYELSTSAMAEEQGPDTIAGCLKHFMEIFSFEAGEIKYLESQKQHFSSPVAHYGLSPNFLKSTASMNIDTCMCGLACKKKEILYTSDLTAEQDFSCSTCTVEGFRSSIAVPIILEEGVIGVIHLASHRKRPFEEEDVKLIYIAGNLLTMALGRLRLMEKARTAKEYLKGIISISADPIAITDLDGTIIDSNPALEKITGQPRKALLKTSVFRLFPEHFLQLIKELRESVIQEGKAREMDTQLLAGPGKSLDVTFSCNLMKKPDGDILGIIGAFKMRAEEQSLQKELRRRNREFASLYSLSNVLSRNQSSEEIAHKTLQELFKIFEIPQKGAFYELKGGAQEFELVTHINMPPAVISKESLGPLGNCACSKAVELGEMQLAGPDRNDSSFLHHGGGYSMVIPAMYQNRVAGGFILYPDSRPSVDPGTTQFLSTIGNLVGAAIEKTLLSKESINLYEQSQKGPGSLRTACESLERLRAADRSDTIYSSFAMILKSVTDFSHLSFILPDGNHYRLLRLSSENKIGTKNITEIPRKSRVNWVITNRKPLLCDNLLKSDIEFPEDHSLIEHRIVSIYTFPLADNNEICGVVNIEKTASDPLGEEKALLLTMLANELPLLRGKPPVPAEAKEVAGKEGVVINDSESFAKQLLESNDWPMTEYILKKASIHWFSPQLIAYCSYSEGAEKYEGFIDAHDAIHQVIIDDFKKRIIAELPRKVKTYLDINFNTVKLKELPSSDFASGIKCFHLITPMKFQSTMPLFFALGADSTDHFSNKGTEMTCFSFLLSLYQLKVREYLTTHKLKSTLDDLKKFISTF